MSKQARGQGHGSLKSAGIPKSLAVSSTSRATPAKAIFDPTGFGQCFFQISLAFHKTYRTFAF
ncbi:MAG: hypothetical protein GXO89_07520 [Chlorobi bacterium]|nr:hypothetical protein [Chlorobiota bacterium]